jgi:hypothetical protein
LDVLATPDTYHLAGIRRGTATSNFHAYRDNLRSDGELVLHEPALAIKEIPIRHLIEGVQERCHRDEGSALAAWRLAKPHLIECARSA